jgi:hypothetical protein
MWGRVLWLMRYESDWGKEAPVRLTVVASRNPKRNVIFTQILDRPRRFILKEIMHA